MPAPRAPQPGQLFVFGTGSFGQLGLGEDVQEKLRPGRVALPGGHKALQARFACAFFLSLYVWVRVKSVRVVGDV